MVERRADGRWRRQYIWCVLYKRGTPLDGELRARIGHVVISLFLSLLFVVLLLDGDRPFFAHD